VLQVIPTRFRSKLSDFRRSGYDRGHMAPAMNHKSSQKDMDDTFFLTNMSPQVCHQPLTLFLDLHGSTSRAQRGFLGSNGFAGASHCNIASGCMLILHFAEFMNFSEHCMNFQASS
jgi:hypothetical protein